MITRKVSNAPRRVNAIIIQTIHSIRNRYTNGTLNKSSPTNRIHSQQQASQNKCLFPAPPSSIPHDARQSVASPRTSFVFSWLNRYAPIHTKTLGPPPPVTPLPQLIFRIPLTPYVSTISSICSVKPYRIQISQPFHHLILHGAYSCTHAPHKTIHPHLLRRKPTRLHLHGNTVDVVFFCIIYL